jgi:tight adherence protein B
LPVVAATGVFYLYTAAALGWRCLGLAPAPVRHPSGAGRVHRWMARNGLAEARPRDLGAAVVLTFVVGASASHAIFGAAVPSLAVGTFAATFPPSSYRMRRSHRRATAQDAWPRLIEEMRILTGSLGRSIPRALFEVGRRAPREMQPAFDAAHREWLVSTDFARTLSVLKAGLADPTADATCETLLVAHSVGGNDLDRTLQALVEDRRQDTQGRKDARAKQAGARFARRFVLFVPFGMAVAGMSVGEGREAFASATGQLLASVAVAVIVCCWAWAGHILRLPTEERVFAG